MGSDIGDVNLKRTVEEIKRLQEEASSLRQENIQLKVGMRHPTQIISHQCVQLVIRFVVHFHRPQFLA